MFSDIECQTTSAECCSGDGDRRTEDLLGATLNTPHSSQLCTHDSETLAEEINSDFPSLQVAALFHEKKHDSCSASVARKLKLSKLHTSNSVVAEDQSPQHQSPTEATCCTPETPESIPACNTFVEFQRSAVPEQSDAVLWKELPRKRSISDDVAIPQRRNDMTDKELERPITGISSSHSAKPLTSMSLVLADFLQPSQVSASADEQCSDEFVPMFVCTLCGDRTHSCRDCSRRLGELFCD